MYLQGMMVYIASGNSLGFSYLIPNGSDVRNTVSAAFLWFLILEDSTSFAGARSLSQQKERMVKKYENRGWIYKVTLLPVFVTKYHHNKEKQTKY